MTLLGIGLIAISCLGGHDHPGHFGHVGHGGIGHGHHGSSDNPGFFNLRVISIFLATAGSSGLLAEYYGCNEIVALAAAFIGGVIFADIARRCIRKLNTMQAETSMNTDFIDLVGIVTLPMSNNLPGEVKLTSKNGQQVWVTVYSKDGQTIGMNDQVKVVANVGGLIQVEKI